MRCQFSQGVQRPNESAVADMLQSERGHFRSQRASILPAAFPVKHDAYHIGPSVSIIDSGHNVQV